MKAIWNHQVIAESNTTIFLEGNHYFPPDSIHKEFFLPSTTSTVCPWKGQAQYKTIVVNEKTNPDAAWYYPTPKSAAAEIKDHFAFWKGVEVIDK